MIILFMHHWDLGYQTVSPPINQFEYTNEDLSGYNNIEDYVSNTCATLDTWKTHGFKNTNINSDKSYAENEFIATLCRLSKHERLFNQG